MIVYGKDDFDEETYWKAQKEIEEMKPLTPEERKKITEEQDKEDSED